jgi:hypothetical protein
MNITTIAHRPVPTDRRDGRRPTDSYARSAPHAAATAVAMVDDYRGPLVDEPPPLDWTIEDLLPPGVL